VKLEDKVAAAIAAIPLELERVRDELTEGLQQFHNGVPLQGARYVPVGIGGRTMAWGGSGRVLGWSLRATGGPVTVALCDGHDTNADPFMYVDLADGVASNAWFGTTGISFVEALFVQALGAGVMQGSVFLGAVD
jgi:hypothetical protein